MMTEIRDAIEGHRYQAYKQEKLARMASGPQD